MDVERPKNLASLRECGMILANAVSSLLLLESLWFLVTWAMKSVPSIPVEPSRLTHPACPRKSQVQDLFFDWQKCNSKTYRALQGYRIKNRFLIEGSCRVTASLKSLCVKYVSLYTSYENWAFIWMS